jgi:hypothetical protein
MRKWLMVFAALLVGAIVTGFGPASCAQVSADNAFCLDKPTYGRTDTLCVEDTTYDFEFYENGSQVFAIDDGGQTLVFANSETIANDTDGELQFSDASEDVSVAFTTNAVVWSSDTGVVAWDLGATGATITLANDETIKNDNNGEIELGDGTEDLAFSFGTNSVELSSDTGVVSMDMTQITTLTLGNDETIKNDNNGEIELGDGTEDLAFSFGTNACVLSSDTGVVELDLGAVGTTLKFANDQTIASGTDNKLTFADNSEDLTIEFKTDEVELSSSTAVATFDFAGVYPIVSGTTAIWSIQAGANTACDTTCTHACVFGFDDGAADAETVVACNDATADKCLCAGAN